MANEGSHEITFDEKWIKLIRSHSGVYVFPEEANEFLGHMTYGRIEWQTIYLLDDDVKKSYELTLQRKGVYRFPEEADLFLENLQQSRSKNP